MCASSQDPQHKRTRSVEPGERLEKDQSQERKLLVHLLSCLLLPSRSLLRVSWVTDISLRLPTSFLPLFTSLLSLSRVCISCPSSCSLFLSSNSLLCSFSWVKFAGRCDQQEDGCLCSWTIILVLYSFFFYFCHSHTLFLCYLSLQRQGSVDTNVSEERDCEWRQKKCKKWSDVKWRRCIESIRKTGNKSQQNFYTKNYFSRNEDGD